MWLGRSERAISSAGRHSGDSVCRGESDLTNVFLVAHTTGLRPGSFREFMFASRVPLLASRGLVKCYSEGWYSLTDRGWSEQHRILAASGSSFW